MYTYTVEHEHQSILHTPPSTDFNLPTCFIIVDGPEVGESWSGDLAYYRVKWSRKNFFNVL